MPLDHVRPVPSDPWVVRAKASDAASVLIDQVETAVSEALAGAGLDFPAGFAVAAAVLNCVAGELADTEAALDRVVNMHCQVGRPTPPLLLPQSFSPRRSSRGCVLRGPWRVPETMTPSGSGVCVPELFHAGHCRLRGVVAPGARRC